MSEPQKSKRWIWILAIAAIVVGAWLIANWSDVSAGFADGFNRQTKP